MTVEASKKIRAALAAKGYGKAEVSVYNKSYSLGSTVYVTIKQAAIPLATIEEIAKCGERIDRDDATGEILGGANCFVDVRYGDGVLDEQAALINRQVAAERRIFGRFELYAKDPFTWGVYETTPDREHRMGMHLDRKLPGAGLARILAAAGELAVLHDDDGALPANEADEPELPSESAPIAPPPARIASTWHRLHEAAIRRANDVAREMAPAALVVDCAAPHELETLRACLDVFAGHVAADRWSTRQALELMAQTAFALGRASR